MQDSIFTRIIKGEIPSFKIAENENFLAFLDVMPLRVGHTLVIPKKQVDYIYDLNDDVLSDLFVFSKQVALKIESKINCKRIGVSVIGLEVPHAHIHLIPIDSVADIDFSQPKLKLNNDELLEVANKINAT
ncbi:MAG: HIT family protein [Crocinitomicaceae bacterium]|nr:HIT family protein [Crocinitomicaceae bacterium]|tara:strand:+ start:615 stop:1007 length:393 start_codon:yes stop_codon:yes gene_type:complete